MRTASCVAAPDAVPSAGAFEATLGDLKGYIRGRVMPNLPIQAGFRVIHPDGNQRRAAWCLPIRPCRGSAPGSSSMCGKRTASKVLAKTIDNKFFQRATVFIGTPEMSHYTIQADVMSDGNRRKMSKSA